MVKVLILYYSMYGHVRQIAEKVKEGLTAEGVEVDIYQLQETLSEAILAKMHAAVKGDHPVFTHDKIGSIPEYDGLLIGAPTRFGVMAAQVKTFWDATGQLWSKQALAGKPGGIFFSTATQNGGQETTALTCVTQFVHHGMVFVPVGYTFGGDQFANEEAHGGSPYGAGTLAGADGSRQPSKYEQEFAIHQGKHFAKIAKKMSGS